MQVTVGRQQPLLALDTCTT